MLGFDIRGYIQRNIGQRWQDAFTKVDTRLVEDAALRTAKLALTNARTHGNVIEYDKDYQEAATAIRTETTDAIRAQNPYKTREEHDDFNSKSMVLSMAITGYAEALVNECLRTPDSTVLKQFITDVERYEPLPTLGKA